MAGMSNAPHSPNAPHGAVPVGDRPTRRTWLLPLLLALLALIALLFLLSRCGGDDDTTSAAPTATATATGAATTTPASPAASAAAASGAPAGEPGTVTAQGADLLADPTAAGLGSHDGQEAVGRAVRVQSVPADEGFWVGSGEQDRLWVQLTGTRGESDYKVRQGDTVDFTGTVTPVAQGFPAEVGLTDAEGAAQLTDQGFYVSVPMSGVKLSR